jgi:hypothetical protein
MEMMKVLEIISSAMESLGLNYEFMLWQGDNVDTYFVGEYEETPIMSEDGFTETSFKLNGVTTGSWLKLEEAKEKIENYFGRISGKTVITDDGSAVAIFYANSFVLPTGGSEFKRIEIHLDVKEWKVSE